MPAYRMSIRGRSGREAESRVGGAIKVASFVRYELGEGIDRPDNDFGGEVAAMAGR